MPAWLNPANFLSLLRLGLAPYVFLLVHARRFREALFLFLLAAVTDGLDGYLARAFRWETRLGALLDPLADKLLLDTIYLGLAFAGTLPFWLAGLVLARDAIIVSVGVLGLRLTTRRQFPPSVWGKLSTAIQITTATFALAACSFMSSGLYTFLPYFVWLTALGTVWSGLHYAWMAGSTWPRYRTPH
jgi:cardiolipin synthase (CMP-forming)